MNKSLAILAATLASLTVTFGAPATNSITGNWLGTLGADTAKLRLLIKIKPAADGTLTATMDSLDQGARDIPVNAVTFKDKTLHLEVKAIQGAFDGTLDATGKTLTGTWQQMSVSLPLTLARQDKAVEVDPPEQLSPEDREANKRAALRLSGAWTATLDAGAAKFRLKLKIAKTSKGAAVGTIESVDQGGKEFPLNAITCKDGAVHFEARGIAASYDGKLSPAGAMMSGEWHQSGQTLPLEFKKAATAR